jgi:2-haloalkanoic acid dehalogenase type II
MASSDKTLPKLSSFKAIGFDVMGTLLDEQTGVKTASSSILSRLPAGTTEQDLYTAFDESMTRWIKENTPPTSYNTLLENAITEAAQKLSDGKLVITHEEAVEFAQMLPHWPPFPDTVASLQYLAWRGYKLILLSNMDTSSLQRIANQQTGSFQDVPLAGLLGGDSSGGFKPDYKVNRNLLNTVQKEYNIAKEHVLLVANGLTSDHVPAKDLGINSVWIDRYGWGREAIPDGASPGWVFNSLKELCDEIKREEKDEKAV